MIRLNEAMKRRAANYSNKLGISMNALIVIALHEYFLAHPLDDLIEPVPKPIKAPAIHKQRKRH